MVRLVEEGVVEAIDGSLTRVQADSICVHGDSPGAVDMAREVHVEPPGISRLGEHVRFLPVNTDALLVELDDLEQTLALFDALQARPIDGVTELVPAARTVLVVFRPDRVTREALIADIGGRDTSGRVARDGTLIEIPVHYNGEDLGEVATLLGIPTEEVVRRHTASTYSVAFTGFAPGFARRERVSRRARWRWPAHSAAFIRKPAPADGRSLA
ncbi:hypothetical protein G6F68_013221 [Rhizopus microsporus]|nr:hypothetical protein G6F68_013221 [Rhizopus microsporus]